MVEFEGLVVAGFGFGFFFGKAEVEEGVDAVGGSEGEELVGFEAGGSVGEADAACEDGGFAVVGVVVLGADVGGVQFDVLDGEVAPEGLCGEFGELDV